jgi:hypothetical protein
MTEAIELIDGVLPDDRVLGTQCVLEIGAALTPREFARKRSTLPTTYGDL